MLHSAHMLIPTIRREEPAGRIHIKAVGLHRVQIPAQEVKKSQKQRVNVPENRPNYLKRSEEMREISPD